MPQQDIIVERNVTVPMRDGITLATDVYRATDNVTPALLYRTPYGKDYVMGTLPAINPIKAASLGFAVVLQDVRGRNASDGEFYPFRNEASDGSDTLAWLMGQPWCNGKVGMFGSSYMAAAQMQTAANSPGLLAAICPIQASSDYYEGRTYRGGAYELGAMLSLALYSLGMGSAERGSDTKRGRALRREALRRLNSLESLAQAVLDREQDALHLIEDLAPFFFDWQRHNTNDAYWQQLSIEPHYPHMTMPSLHITSWYDAFHVGTIRNWAGMRHSSAQRAADHRLLIGPWAHYPPRTALVGTAVVSDRNFGLSAVLDLEEVQLRWFRSKLLDEDAGWEWPAPVRLFVMGSNDWRWEDDFPPPDTSTERLYLCNAGTGADHLGDLRLSWHHEPAVSTANYLFDPRDPAPTLGGAHLIMESACAQGPVDQRRITERPDVIVYTSDALAEDIEIIGWVRANLHVASDGPCTDFTVKLVDVDPAGLALNICDGIQRVTLPSAANTTTSTTVELGATAIALAAGHRLQVQISSSNFPRFEINPNTGRRGHESGEWRSVRQTVFHGGNFASHLEIPIRQREPHSGR